MAHLPMFPERSARTGAWRDREDLADVQFETHYGLVSDTAPALQSVITCSRAAAIAVSFSYAPCSCLPWRLPKFGHTRPHSRILAQRKRNVRACSWLRRTLWKKEALLIP